MVQKVVTELVDDITGDPAVETIMFTVRGVTYEFDASAETAREFDEAFAGYVESARRVGKAASSAGHVRGVGRAPVDREQTRAIREWAREQGHAVSNRGRIPADVKKAFEAAHRAAA